MSKEGAVFLSLILGLFIRIFGIYIIWNDLIPDLFGLPNITLGQSLGLVALVYLLTPQKTHIDKDDD